MYCSFYIYRDIKECTAVMDSALNPESTVSLLKVFWRGEDFLYRVLICKQRHHIYVMHYSHRDSKPYHNIHTWGQGILFALIQKQRNYSFLSFYTCYRSDSLNARQHKQIRFTVGLFAFSFDFFSNMSSRWSSFSFHTWTKRTISERNDPLPLRGGRKVSRR